MNAESEIFQAIKENDFDRFSDIVASGADLNVLGGDGRTPLMVICQQGKQRWFQCLMDHGVDVNAKGRRGETALLVAAGACCPSFVETLVDKGADIEVAGGFTKKTPLIAANGSFRITKFLLASGANVNAVGEHNETALTSVIGSYREAAVVEQVVKLLIEYKADVNWRNELGQTSLMRAADGFHQCIEMLVKSGSCVDAVDNTGRTALMYAAIANYRDSIRLLVKHGADIRLKDEAGLSAYHHAALNNSLGNLQYIIERGVDINELTNYNETALILAVKAEHEPTVKLLIEAGIDVSMSDKSGKTALDYARELDSDVFPYCISLIESSALNNAIDSCEAEAGLLF